MKDAKKTNKELLEELEALRAESGALKTRLKDAEGKHEGSVRDTESFYRTIIEDLPELICRWLPDGTMTFVNDNYCRYFGKTREDLIGKSFMPFIHEDDRDRVKKHFEGFSAEKPLAYNEERVVLPGGGIRWQKWANWAIFDSEGKIKEFQSIGYDITDGKNACEENSKLQTQLLQAQRMAAVGALAGGVAHDFNNIITAIKLLTDLMMEKVGEGDRLRACLEPISESAKRAMNLVQQLVLFSRNKPVSMAAINLNDAANELISMLDHLISEDISIETNLEYGLWNIKADKGRIEQVITNLVVNASEAMPQGGSVVVRTENLALSDEKCRAINGAVPGKFVCLSVADTGIGMDKDVLERVFEPFFTTKATRGTGMGLAVVYGIVKEHQGWINVSSEPGVGTVFKIYLPAVEAQAEEVTEPREKKRFSGSGKRILLVEDEKWIRKSTAMVLTENGYTVFEAANAENAISLFYREKGRFDLVLSDVVMPGRSGLQMVSPLLDINPRIPILLCSGHLDDKSQLSEIIKRGLAYIQKPFEISELLNAVEETIKQG